MPQAATQKPLVQPKPSTPTAAKPPPPAAKSYQRLQAQRPVPEKEEEETIADQNETNIVEPSRPIGHLTKDGKPDRRYGEYQDMTPQEAEVEAAKIILQQHK